MYRYQIDEFESEIEIGSLEESPERERGDDVGSSGRDVEKDHGNRDRDQNP